VSREMSTTLCENWEPADCARGGYCCDLDRTVSFGTCADCLLRAGRITAVHADEIRHTKLPGRSGKPCTNCRGLSS